VWSKGDFWYTKTTSKHVNQFKTEPMEKPNKGGRPSKGAYKLDKVLPCRLTIAEYEKIVQAAIQCQLKPSVFARHMLVKGQVSNVFSAEEQEAKRQLIGMRNNLNQLTKLAHIDGIDRQVKDLENIIRGIDAILIRYRQASQKQIFGK
jgi:hypothetical protein